MTMRLWIGRLCCCEYSDHELALRLQDKSDHRPETDEAKADRIARLPAVERGQRQLLKCDLQVSGGQHG